MFAEEDQFGRTKQDVSGRRKISEVLSGLISVGLVVSPYWDLMIQAASSMGVVIQGFLILLIVYVAYNLVLNSSSSE